MLPIAQTKIKSSISNKNSKNKFDNKKTDVITDGCGNIDEREGDIIDARGGFAWVDYEFIDADFDVYTTAYYLRIVRRAYGSRSLGFIEKRSTTKKSMRISRQKIIECTNLLIRCNIICVESRTNENGGQISNKIILTHKNTWDLNHDHRDAREFENFKRSPRGGHPPVHVVGTPCPRGGHPPPLKKSKCSSLTKRSPRLALKEEKQIEEKQIKTKTNTNVWIDSRSISPTITEQPHTIKNSKSSTPTAKSEPIVSRDIVSPPTRSTRILRPVVLPSPRDVSVPINLQWKLSDMLRCAFGRRFVDNNDCAEIIRTVLERTHRTSNELREILNEITQCNYPPGLIFSSHRFDLERIKNDLSHWITDKDKIIATSLETSIDTS